MATSDPTPIHGEPAAPPPGLPPPVRPPRAPRRWARALGLALLVAPLVLAAALWQALHRPDGIAWLLAQAGVTAQGIDGTPLGGRFAVQRLHWGGAAGQLDITGLAWRDLQWRWRPHAGAWLGLSLEVPSAERVQWRGSGADSPPGAPPASLRLPLSLALDSLVIGELRVDDLPPVIGLRATAELGADGGRTHRVSELALGWDRVRVRLRGDVGTEAPLPVSVQAQVEGTVDPSAAGTASPVPSPLPLPVPAQPLPTPTTPPWQADLALDGTLTRLQLDATLASTVPPAQADLQTVVEPWNPWPITMLQASTRGLDLRTLMSSLPSTRLDVQATVDVAARDAPVRIDLRLDNRMPGRWDTGSLPVASLTLGVQGRTAEPDTIEIHRFDVQFAAAGPRSASTPTPAGAWAGQGRWQGGALTLDTRFEALRPALLVRRAPALTLGGPVSLKAEGLPSPARWFGRDGAAPAAATLLKAVIDARLDGRLEQRGLPPARVETEVALAQGPRWAVDVRRFEMQAGGARATATLRADPQATGWQLRGDGAVSNLDPLPFWPAADPDWRAGTHRVNGQWRLDVAVPARWPASVPAWRVPQGEATLTLGDSLLSGVPLRGRALWRQGPGSGPTQLELDASAAGNDLRLRGQLGAAPADLRAQAQVQGPALSALAPLARTFPALADWIPTAGTLDGQASVQGAWPRLRTDGELRTAGLRVAGVALDRATARWRLALPDPRAGSPVADEPLQLALQAQGLAQGERRIDRLQVALDGSWRQHRLSLEATSPLRPPAWIDAWMDAVPVAAPAASAGATASNVMATGAPSAADPAADAGQGSRLRLQAEGSWRAAAAGGSLWQGRIAELLGTARQPADTRPWLVARDLALQAQLDADARPVDVQARSGRVELLGAAVRWNDARWRPPAAAGQAPRVELDAELEPLPVATILQKLQPAFGWQGDLQVGGRVQVRGGERFDADVVIERRRGDLQVRDESGLVQALGLSDLRVSLAAHDGTWYVTQAMAGSNVGVLAGALVMRVSPQAALPPPSTPIDGVIELRVANLAVWAPWVPPGWRLGGQLRTSARLGGTLAVPQYTGEIVGSGIAVRNLLEGVDIRDGDLEVDLQGEQARIERFTLRGGDGRLTVEGGATFGQPTVLQLSLKAERFQALSRVDRRVVVSGQARLSARERSAKLEGQLQVDEGLFDFSRADAPTLDRDVVVLRRGQGAVAQPVSPGTPAPGTPEVPAAPKPPLAIDLALRLDLGDRLRLRGRGIETLLKGQLAISAPNGQPALDGTVRAVDGQYAAYGQKLQIERGLVVFTGPPANPRLDILALRPNLDVRVGVSIGGTAQNPRIRLYSEPDMADVDKLSWLVMGRAPDGLGRADTALLQRAALALLSGEGEGVTDQVLRNFGLDDFGVSQTDDGTVRDTVVTLGKQLGRRWYVGYERGVNATQGTWQLIYRVARRFTLRAQAGDDSSVDVIWTWRWN